MNDIHTVRTPTLCCCWCQMLWTNDPILEYNPATKTTKLPSYMKARLSSSSSTQSLKQRLSQGSQ